MAYDEDDDASEYPDASDLHDSGDEDADVLDPCPHCRRLLYDDSERCPHCGQYVTMRKATGDRPLWFILTAIVCLAVAVYVLFR